MPQQNTNAKGTPASTPEVATLREARQLLEQQAAAIQERANESLLWARMYAQQAAAVERIKRVLNHSGEFTNIPNATMSIDAIGQIVDELGQRHEGEPIADMVNEIIDTMIDDIDRTSHSRTLTVGAFRRWLEAHRRPTGAGVIAGTHPTR